MDYPTIVILGDFGSGKTLYMTYIAIMYHLHDGLNIFANYKLEVPYREITFKDIANFPDWLHDGVLAMDETQVGADSYKFLDKNVQDMTQFFTQLRKRRLILVMTTQRFNFIAKRIRQLTNYAVEVENLNNSGLIRARTYSINRGYELTQDKTYDLKLIYPLYDTSEVITNDEG